MSFGPESLRLQNQRMLTLNGIVDDSTRQIVRGFTRAWDQVAGELSAALEVAAEQAGAGGRVTWRQLNQVERFQAALARLVQQLDDLAATGRVEIVNAAGDAVSVAREFEPRLIASQLPNVGPSTTALAAELGNAVAGPAFDAIVARAQDNIVSRLQPLSADAMAAMRRELVRGITVGDNPRRAAARMLSRLEGQFAGGLTRALRIARTEQLDAYRMGNQLVDLSHPDIVTGWTWVAALDGGTCIACASMHGSTFPNSDPGPEGHVQCRCDRVPTTAPWADLGFPGVQEPPSLLPDARQWFDGLDEAAQLDIMGPGRLEAFRSGQVEWGQLARRVDNPDWRPSYQVTPLKDLGVNLEAATV